MQSFLSALSRVPGGTAVSVSYFFPPVARKLLYTYPDPKVDNIHQDCFWSAMNFFNDIPDNRYFDWKNTVQVLRSEYTQEKEAKLFGDLILLVDDRLQAIHMCVYIARQRCFYQKRRRFSPTLGAHEIARHDAPLRSGWIAENPCISPKNPAGESYRRRDFQQCRFAGELWNGPFTK